MKPPCPEFCVSVLSKITSKQIGDFNETLELIPAYKWHQLDSHTHFKVGEQNGHHIAEKYHLFEAYFP